MLLQKWKTFVALILMGFAIFFDWSWFWAWFIILGLLNVIASGEIHFVEEVKKGENPKLFWVMIVIWSFLAMYSIYGYIVTD